ncbi:hypothetical protein, partial [Microcoleus sp. B13-B4]|uniref:hypothetical protein n=1 Tax=Microcoleus sp. B13-B4 TaxID=2818651 RepID=UPI002FCF563B
KKIHFLWNRPESLFVWAGPTPTPQKNSFLVEQAGKPVCLGGRDAHPTKKFISCGTGRKACS